jgi:hypothetical protein
MTRRLRGGVGCVKGQDQAIEHPTETFTLDAWPSWAPWALLLIGVLGMVARTAHFVRVTIPHHYGSNPGFGAYETSCLPWWLILSTGVGLATSLRVGAAVFVFGLFGLGLFAQFVARISGD